MAIESNVTQLRIGFSAYDTRTIGLSSNVRTPVTNAEWTFTFGDGTGALQFQKAYAVERTLPGATEDVDLAGVLADVFGSTITATEVKAWGVKNTSASNNLSVGATGGSNWTACLNGTVTLHPGAVMAFATPDAGGWAVTAGSADLIRMAGTSGQPYQLILWVN